MNYRRRLAGIAGVAALAMTASGCGGSASSPARAGAGPLNIVAAQNFWGSIVTQLAGTAGNVTSIVNDPNTDPHEYEASTNDARAFATADYVILNGAGYDTWADKLLAGNPNPRRKVIVVADVLGKKQGDNPHFWYHPDYVTAVTNQVQADLKALDPAQSAYFDVQRQAFDQASAPYRDRLAMVKARFAGTPVGATESIFVYLANALGLKLISPPEFMQAVAEGNDPPAATVGQFQDQISQREIRVFVYNLQTATVVTSNLKKLAAQKGIPAVGITETIEPPGAPFEQWMEAQLQSLQNALSASADALTAPSSSSP